MQTNAKVKPQRPSIEFPFQEPLHPANLIEVAPGVHWLRVTLAFALDHINLWLLEDGDGWTIVDSGFGDGETRELWEKIFGAHLNGKPVTRIPVTHVHPDHFGLAAWLSERWRVPVPISKPELAAAQAWFEGGPLHRRDARAAMFKFHGLELPEQTTQQTLFPMRETLSHINYLHRRGKLAQHRDSDGIYRYARASGETGWQSQ